MSSKNHKSRRAAIYARVSTEDKGQVPENQVTVLREYCHHRGFKVVDEFVDKSSGRTDQRPEFQRMLMAARRRHIDVVLVWRYDRFARSTKTLLNALEEFKVLGVDFISHQGNIDTTTPHGELFFTIASGFAQFESSLISERVKLGMARARKQNKHLGRARLPLATQRKIRKLRAGGLSLRKVAAKTGVTHVTVRNYEKSL